MNIKINDKVFDNFPVLESERLRFRAFEKKDAQGLFLIRSNSKVMEFMDTLPQTDIKEAEQFVLSNQNSFKKKEGINWAIEEKSSNKFIGYFGFWRLIQHNCRAEIGYALRPSSWGKGYMNEALNTMTKFAFEELMIHSIEANVNPNNKGSIKLLERNGFVQEAYFKEDYLFNGKFVDSMIFSLLEPTGTSCN